jgi:serine/threonine-protein kinase
MALAIPKVAQAHTYLRELLLRQGRLAEARRAWEEALRHGPAEHEAWSGYAELCLFLGEEDLYRQASADLLRRFAATAHPNIAERTARACLLRPNADALASAAALADRAAAAEKHPHHVFFQAVRGLAEYRRGRPASAVDVLRPVANRIGPPMAKLVLAMALHRQGQTADALRTLRAAIASFDWRHSQARSADAWIAHVLRREAEELLLAELKNVLQEQAVAATAPLVDQAAACAYRLRSAAAVRLYHEAFAADPKLADNLQGGHRYNAACHAALAAAAQGEDAALLDEAAKAKLRGQALDWLRADLALRVKQLESGTPADRTEVQKQIAHWQQDPDLAGLRDAMALARLPADEHKAWTQLWADVAAVWKKAGQ